MRWLGALSSNWMIDRKCIAPRKSVNPPWRSLTLCSDPNCKHQRFLQSEVGEVFGEIGGELPAKFGRRFSSFFCRGKSSEAFSTKTPPQISPSNFTTRFWVVAGPKIVASSKLRIGSNCNRNSKQARSLWLRPCDLVRFLWEELLVPNCDSQSSETGRIRFRRVRFQTPSSVSFLALTEFRGENSVSSSQPIICVIKRTHRDFSQNSPSFETVLPQNSVSSPSETVLSKLYSARFLNR